MDVGNKSSIDRYGNNGSGKFFSPEGALPSLPQYMCDVEIPAGTSMRTGIANEVSGWGAGGGKQYDLMGQTTGKFVNQRPLKWKVEEK